MNLTMISKSLLIALPMLALGACSSTTESEATKSASQQAATNTSENNNGVQTESIEVGDVIELTDEEIMVKEYTSAILESTILFDFDAATIKPQFATILDAHAKFLIDHPAKVVVIEGHTDAKGTPEYNIALGERRAASVATYLENMGVMSKQISVVSYGEEKPVNFEHNESGWAENRRAELTY
ncbi:peptidoglycan-associated lipoprotein Pal [Psychromonas sp. MME2]|uniref:peptidoglycan-associated lipoprotein Pal n=1 Tax=unclassified Psychromonas TaxID=2614957 RepID=UPI00339C9C37